jgi:hypothetical protein
MDLATLWNVVGETVQINAVISPISARMFVREFPLYQRVLEIDRCPVARAD